MYIFLQKENPISLNRSYEGHKNNVLFGSPSYPSPLDRIRTGKRERAAQLGIPAVRMASFEANQSFPKFLKSRLKVDPQPTPDAKKKIENVIGKFA